MANIYGDEDRGYGKDELAVIEQRRKALFPDRPSGKAVVVVRRPDGGHAHVSAEHLAREERRKVLFARLDAKYPARPIEIINGQVVCNDSAFVHDEGIRMRKEHGALS